FPAWPRHGHSGLAAISSHLASGLFTPSRPTVAFDAAIVLSSCCTDDALMPPSIARSFSRYLVLFLIIAFGATALAQRGFGRFRLPEGAAAYPPRYPPANFEDGSFMICKLQYTSVRYEAMGMGWSTDYPYAGINLMIRMSELTRAHIT